MSARPPAQPGPPRYKVAVLTWIALYPTITLFSWLLTRLGPIDPPLPLRTLVLTALLVPAMVFLLVPALTRVLEPWLSQPTGSPPALRVRAVLGRRHRRESDGRRTSR